MEFGFRPIDMVLRGIRRSTRRWFIYAASSPSVSSPSSPSSSIHIGVHRKCQPRFPVLHFTKPCLNILSSSLSYLNSCQWSARRTPPVAPAACVKCIRRLANLSLLTLFSTHSTLCCRPSTIKISYQATESDTSWGSPCHGIFRRQPLV
jgi:hypothetical protein